MLAGIDRYLKENNYHVSIIRDRVFSTSRENVKIQENMEKASDLINLTAYQRVR